MLYLWAPEQVVFLLPLFVQDAVLCIARPHHHVLYQRIVILQYPLYKYFYKTSFSLVPLQKLLILFCANQKLFFWFFLYTVHQRKCEKVDWYQKSMQCIYFISIFINNPKLMNLIYLSLSIRSFVIYRIQ